MPRAPQIRYYHSRKAYYTKYQGKQHLLAAGPKDEPDGPTWLKAVERFSLIMHAADADRAEDNTVVSVIISRYIWHLKREGREGSKRFAETVLLPAVSAFGHVKIKELKSHAVTDWLASCDNWNTSTKSKAIANLLTAFYWAKSEGMITRVPIEGMKKPEERVRGKGYAIPAELQELLIQEANSALAKVLRVLQLTGARPGEILFTNCERYRPDIGAIVLPWNPPPGEWRWKNGKKTKRDRVIYLPPAAQAIVEDEIAQRQGRGRIFLTLRRKPWVGIRLSKMLWVIAARKSVLEWCKENNFDSTKIIPYGFRHAYITRMILAGCPIKTVADLCGTSAAMIEKVYSHGHDDLQAMRRLAMQFSIGVFGAASAVPSPQPCPSVPDETP